MSYLTTDDPDDVVSPKDLDKDPTTPPSVETDIIQEDITDIDEEMKKVGLRGDDDDGPKRLGED